MGEPVQHKNENNKQPSNNQGKNGEECQGMQKMLERWEEWTKECFSKEQQELIPKTEHITEQERGQTFLQAPKDLQIIREKAELTKITKNKPEIEAWINREYTEQDIERER